MPPAPVRAARVAAVLSGLVLLVVAVALAPAASAHDSLAGSVPADGARLTSAPTTVVLQFEEAPLEAGLAVAVTAPDSSLVTAGTPARAGTDVVVALPPLTVSGTYTVAWRAVAADGHPVTGSYHFSLDLAAASGAASSGSVVTTAPPEPSSSSSALPDVSHASQGGDLTPWMVGGSVVLLGAIVLIGLLARRRSA